MKKIISVILLAAMLLTACGSEEIPELISPVMTGKAYYTVQKGDIRSETVLDGYITPATETVYFETDGTAYDVCYKPGDEVLAGDIIITLNQGVNEQLAALEAELNQYETLSSYYVLQQEAEIADMRNALSSKSGADYGLYEIEIKEKQIEFDLFNAQRADEYESIKAEYAELQDKAEKSFIEAPCDGKIVYMGVYTDNDSVNKYDVACVIADETQKYVQFEYETEEYINALDEFCIQIGSEKYYDVSYVAYTEEELEYNKLYGGELYSRAVIDSLPEDTEPGTYCAIHQVTDTAEDVLYVPNESLNYSNTEYLYYCLVLQEDGTEEKVTVKPGTVTAYYTEITEGLAEGQSVYFAEDLSVWNSDMTSMEAYIGDYTHTLEFSEVSKTAQVSEPIVVGFSGTVSEIFLEKTSDVYVEKDTPLFSVQTTAIEESKYEAAKLEYETAEKEYAAGVADYNDKIAQKEEEVDEAANTVEKKVAQYELDKLTAEKEQYVEKTEQSLSEMEEKIYIYDLCQQESVITVTASVSGNLDLDITLVQGMTLAENTYIGTISDSESYMCYVTDTIESTIEDALLTGCIHYGSDVTIVTYYDEQETEIAAKAVTAYDVTANSGYYDETGTFYTEAALRLENEEDAVKINNNGKMNSARVTDIEISDVVLIETKYVNSDENGRYVLVPNGDALVKKYIQTGAVIQNATVTWVKSGLEAGDICVMQ